MMSTSSGPMIRGRAPCLLPTYLNFVVSVIWSYCIVFCLIVGMLWAVGVADAPIAAGVQLVPEWWGLTLALTYLAQALVSHLLESRYERGMLRSLFWMIWYPLAFWLLSALTAVVALPRALAAAAPGRPGISPDRGLR